VTKVGLAGLGYWGPNLARNFDELAELTWLCDLDEQNLTRFRSRFPTARLTADFDDLLADTSLEAVVIATPVPTHFGLARRALDAGKHVLVEKPPALAAPGPRSSSRRPRNSGACCCRGTCCSTTRVSSA
jgi:predicted dehydrogenase